MNVKIILILFIITITLNSCKKYYDYNANYDGDKLVVNGTIEANIGVAITLSKSQSPAGIIKKEGFNVKNGRIWLYQNDTLVSEMTLNAKGKYTINNFSPQVGKTYKIKAVAESLDTAESLPVIVPQLPIINSYVLKKDDSYAFNQGYGGAFFSVNIKDDALEKNFYLINSEVQISRDSINNGFNSYVPHDYSSCEFGGSALAFFTDKCFNGSNFTIDYASEHKNKGTWKVKLSSINKIFFTYLHIWEQPTGLQLGFSEPNLAVSNIKNGYGVLVAKNTLTFSLKLD